MDSKKFESVWGSILKGNFDKCGTLKEPGILGGGGTYEGRSMEAADLVLGSPPKVVFLGGRGVAGGGGGGGGGGRDASLETKLLVLWSNSLTGTFSKVLSALED